jgi:hypothetical protein
MRADYPKYRVSPPRMEFPVATPLDGVVVELDAAVLEESA